MNRSLLPFAVFAIVLCGCGNSAPAVTPSDSAVTPSGALPPESPGASLLSCDDVTLVLDPALASGAACEVVPAYDDALAGNPRYIRLELEGYPLADTLWSPEISVYPVSEYEAMVYLVPEAVANLEASIASGDPVTDEWGQLPFLSNPDVGQFYFAQFEVIPFENGTGIRYLTGFTQDMGTFGNPELYTYQALTGDGRYWISAVFPITHPMLPEPAWPPEDMTEDEFFANYDAYVADWVSRLNAQATDSFTPTIDDLDALVGSIVIAPDELP